MKVNVLFFGATADVVGERRIEVPIEDNTRADVLLNELLQRFPKLGSHKLLFSINQEYTAKERIVADGDEMAVFTAVSGG